VTLHTALGERERESGDFSSEGVEDGVEPLESDGSVFAL